MSSAVRLNRRVRQELLMSAPVPSTIRRAAILFAGGPAPAANAVISTAAASMLKRQIEVLGLLNGYSNLVRYAPDKPLQPGVHFIALDGQMLRRTRNLQGIIIGTARTNPGEYINSPHDLDEPQNVAPLARVYAALCSLSVDALISIGGDDTLKTANKLKLFQDRLLADGDYAKKVFPDGLPAGTHRIPVVHVPKTIDNDYHGIDFTFGYFTAVNFLGTEVRNLLFDAEASKSYFIAETMGRSAGWLAYGTAIAGEASLVISVEDIMGKLAAEETELEIAQDERGIARRRLVDDPISGERKLEDVMIATLDAQTGLEKKRKIMNVMAVAEWIVELMLAREAQHKHFGVIVMAEGLAELLPWEHLKDAPRDEHNHVRFADVNVGRKFARWVTLAYERITEKRFGASRTCKVVGLQLGYESRCAQPSAFDVMLGSQLGVGAYRALVENGLDGVMVSVEGQLKLRYESFSDLIDAETLVTKVRYVEPNSDFHKLARFLETAVNV
jgi:6-phosphofructokinase